MAICPYKKKVWNFCKFLVIFWKHFHMYELCLKISCMRNLDILQNSRILVDWDTILKALFSYDFHTLTVDGNEQGSSLSFKKKMINIIKSKFLSIIYFIDRLYILRLCNNMYYRVFTKTCTIGI